MTSKLFQLRAGFRRRATDPSGSGIEPAHRKHNRIQSRGHSTAIARIASIVVVWAPAMMLQACSNPGIPDRPPRSGVGTPVVTVEADWNDIDAAIARAAPRAAVAVLSHDYTDKVERVITLLAADGQTARLRFTTGSRTGDGADGVDEPRPITVEATFGAPADPGRSAALAGLVADELRALAGRAVAPR